MISKTRKEDKRMWNWAHFKEEGWISHTTRSIKLALLLLASGAAMLLHIAVPFWEQPKRLQACSVANTICEEMSKRE
jgi:hypothetical protein